MARTGVQIYEDEQGNPVREARPPSEVAKSASLMRGLVVTLQHPGDGPDDDQGRGEVTPTNARELFHGTVLEATPDWPAQGLLGGWIRLASAEIQAAAGLGLREQSVGYTAVLRDPADPEVAHLVEELGPEPGVTHEGEHYDLIQTEITPNHHAWVDQARAGRIASARLDGRAMKTISITYKRDGQTVTAQIPAWATTAAEATAKVTKADAEGVLAVSIEGMPDMVLPESMVKQMIASIGGASAAAGPSVPEPAADMGGEMDPSMMSDAEEEDEPMDGKPKMDGITQADVDAMVKRALDRAMPKVARTVTDAVTTTSRERGALERDAQVVLGVRHDFAGADDHEVALQVLAAAKFPRLETARKLAGLARKGDAMAAGRLREMMDSTISARRDAMDSSSELAGWVFDTSASQTRTDADDDETPERVRVAREKRDRARGAAA